jgi:hypothetical protein
MLPFLIWPMAATWQWVGERAANRRLLLQLMIIALAIVSFIITWSLTVGGQYYTPDDILNPLIEYSWPQIIAGDVARNFGMVFGLYGVASLIPLAILVMVSFVIVWRTTRPQSEAAHG